MESHHSCLMHCLDVQMHSEYTFLSTFCVLKLMDHWKELAIAVLSVLLQSPSTINTCYFYVFLMSSYCGMLVRMDLTENRLDVCMALMMADLLPQSMIIASIITRFLSSKGRENVRKERRIEM